jgi:negative regulator of sigma E activity
MKPLDFLDRLARQAKTEPVPAIGVRDAVLARVRQGRPKPAWSMTPLWAMAVSLAPAAAAAMILAVNAWGTLGPYVADGGWTGPFDDVLASFRTVMP